VDSFHHKCDFHCVNSNRSCNRIGLCKTIQRLGKKTSHAFCSLVYVIHKRSPLLLRFIYLGLFQLSTCRKLNSVRPQSSGKMFGWNIHGWCKPVFLRQSMRIALNIQVGCNTFNSIIVVVVATGYILN